MSQINEVPSLDTAPAGSIRFNTDSAKMEIYNGEAWWEIDATSPELQTGGTRGLWFGAEAPSKSDRIQFVNVSSTGNAIDFGDMTDQRTELEAFASRTRGFSHGGFFGSQPTEYTNTIDMVTIASTGNATDFADAHRQTGQAASAASSTRAVTAGGVYSGSNGAVNNNIDFYTMPSQANGLDFGDLSITSRGLAACSSPTRGIFFLGDNAGSTKVNTIEFVTISTTGNSSDFGDSTVTARYSGGCSNATRGINAGGNTGSVINTIDYITIASTGNATDFGDLYQSTSGGLGGVASSTRGVFAGGYAPSKIDVIQFVQIMTTGNSIDFGNLLEVNQYCYGVSNGHGGLG